MTASYHVAGRALQVLQGTLPADPNLGHGNHLAGPRRTHPADPRASATPRSLGRYPTSSVGYCCRLLRTARGPAHRTGGSAERVLCVADADRSELGWAVTVRNSGVG